MPSEKTDIIEWLFDKVYDPKTKQLSRTVITLSEVQEAIRHSNEVHGTSLSDRNPANFMKDIVRGQNASNVWPKKLVKLKWTATQMAGDGNAFEFVRFDKDQVDPFEDRYKPSPTTLHFKIESVSMPIYARMLGRADEAWLTQTAVNLRLVETHFATVSDLDVLQLTHLQMSVKLRHTEIDALFLAIYEDAKGEQRQAIITCEAKQTRERILEHQLLAQAQAAMEVTKAAIVVPIAIRAVKGGSIYLAEFQPLTRKEVTNVKKLEIAKEAQYELVPRVPGI